MKHLALFKNEKVEGKQPQYSLSASVKLPNGDYETFQVGSGWVKTSKTGKQYISIALKNVFVSKEGKEYPGFRLVKEMPAKPKPPVEQPESPVQKEEVEIPMSDMPFAWALIFLLPNIITFFK